MSDGHHPIRWQEADPIMEAVTALRAAGIDVQPTGEDFWRWRVVDFLLSDAELWRLAASRGLVEDGDSR